MEHTSKGAELLRQHTAKAATQEGAKWTPETGWTDQTLRHTVTVYGRRWCDRNGNVTHTVTIHADGRELMQIQETNGYESAYEYTAADAMEKAGMMPGRKHHANGSSEPAWQYWERHGVTYNRSAVDVPRRQDL
jgi:hypothetical protein